MRPDFYAEYYEVEDTHWWFLGRRRILETTLDRWLPSVEGRERRILDVGCGTGTMVARLARYGDAEGIDLDIEAIRFCRARGVDRVQQVDGFPWPYADDTFDLVCCLDVLEHVEDDEEMMREIRRVLRPGGTLLTTVPAYRFLWGQQDEISFHFRRYVASDFAARLQRSGLAVRHQSYFNTLLFPPIAAVRLLRRALPQRGEARSDFEMTEPGRLNRALSKLFGAEARVVAGRRLPFGVSIVAVATPAPLPAPAPAAQSEAPAMATT